METTKLNKVQELNFTNSDERIYELLQRLHKLSDLQAVSALTDWDQQTAMPSGANEIRGYQMATLQGILHEHWTAPRLGELIKALTDVVETANYTEADRGLVRLTKHYYDRATKLPRELVEEMERVRINSTGAWINARQNNDFDGFAPWLKRTIEIQREVADRLGYSEARYDALLDESEPGLTTSRAEELFAPVRQVSTNLLKNIQASGKTIDDSSILQKCPIDQQQVLCEKLLQAIGYDFNRGQMARSAHPFTTSFGSPDDVRLTVRYNEKLLKMSFMAALHEGGHALYEQGQTPGFKRTPLASGASMGAHESQSRLWENYIGRTLPFWKGQYHKVREAFPEQFQDVDVETFVRTLNKVEPSLIRVEADEVTYNMHIIIRFELEKAMVNGDVAVESLPGLWNARYRDYLGITPENDTVGILQDIHWTSGFGYFPSYTLGNLYAAQINHVLRQVFPDMDERFASGDTDFALRWLREHMYNLGAIYRPAELIQHVTGEEANPQYFVRYLTDKFTQIYDLNH